MERASQKIQAPLQEQDVAEQPQAIAPGSAGNVAQQETAGDECIRQRVAQYLTQRLAQTINVEESRIDAHAALEKYGIDSLMALTLTRELEALFGPLPVTLFFEHQSIDELAGYFIAHHGQTLSRLLDAPQEERAAPNGKKRRRGQRGWPSTGNGGAARNAPQSLDIAIIGISGRYPGATDLNQFWRNLLNGVDCITPIPPERWEWRRYFPQLSEIELAGFSTWGGFIDGVDEFDPQFFNISPREAEYIDPQERLFLQCAWHAIEDAGYTRQRLSAENGMTGVFAGVMYEEYQLYGAQAQTQGRPVLLSGSAASVANRVSYFCNFQGPSLAVDTMCSSSLTAIHLACHSLRRGECSVALAGGVNVSVHPNKYLLLSQIQAGSTHGRCKSFGEGGDGYIPAEGVGAVVLKPLQQAVADGDHIYGVIKGSALNHGGKVNGYTVPNPKMQSWVVRRALRESGVDA
ncbi:type I polyketide synthase, partial [Enterobacillus tribolii]